MVNADAITVVTFWFVAMQPGCLKCILVLGALFKLVFVVSSFTMISIEFYSRKV